jgi:O-antigen/teichoic acid export membrane protein
MVAGAGWMMAWRVVSRSLGFVSMLILAQLLMPKDFGVVAVATSISGALDSLSRLQVRDALVRLHEERRDFYDTAFTLQVARALLTGLLLVVFSHYAAGLFGDARLTRILMIIGGFAVISGCENIGVVSFSRELNFRIQFLMQVAPRLIGFAVTTVAAFLTHDYRALIWGMGVSSVSTVVVSYCASAYRPRFGLTGWQQLLGFSFWTWAAGLAAMVWTRADSFLLAPVLGTAVFGIFAVGVEIACLPLTELLEPLCATLFPGFSMAQRSGTAPVSIGLSVAGIVVLGTIPFALGISACSGYLIAGLLGPKWETARPVIAIFTWVCIFSPFSYVTASVLSAHGSVWRVFVSHAFAAVVKVLVILIVRYTHNLTIISAAAVATVAVESSMFIYQLCAAGSGELRRLAAAMTRATIATLLTAGLLVLLPGTWSQVTVWRVEALVIGAAIGLLTFVVFGVCQYVLWWLAGCPAGVEERLAGVVHRVLRPAIWLKRIRGGAQP